MSKKLNRYLFVVIILIAFLLRFYQLTDNPPSLNWDEVSHGYNAYSILKTGRDEWGQLLPIMNFRAYGDYPLALNLYLTIPFISIFGLNELSIRLPHILLGVLTVVASYYLACGLTNKRKYALLTSLLVTVHPWYLFTSRFVNQANLSIFLLISSMAFFVNRDKNKSFLPFSFLCLGLTLFSYHTTRIFTPLFLFGLLVLYRNEFITYFRKKNFSSYLSAMILLIFFLPLPFVLAKPEARARSNEVFLVDAGMVGEILQKRESSNLPVIITRLMHNRPVYFIKAFTRNYLDYYSPNFLFLKGGTQYQFSLPGKGLFYPVCLPFFYLGLVWVIKQVLMGKKQYQLILIWLILAPIPASMTKEKLAVLRSSAMLPLPDVISALGFYHFLSWLKIKAKDKIYLKRVAIGLSSLLLIMGVYKYLREYFNDYREDYSWSWQYGYKQVVNYTKNHYQEYDKIIITKKYGEPHEYFLFFWPWDPVKYRNASNLIRFNQSNWFWVDRFDKLYFVNDWDIPQQEWDGFRLESGEEFNCENERCLLITNPDNYPKGWNIIKKVNYLDSKPAFEILENI